MHSCNLKQFFGAYPRALTQLDPNGGNILHKIINPAPYRQALCEVDLIKWIVERCPSSTLLETDSDGRTPLYLACGLLFSEDNERDSSEICKYLVQMCPSSVQMANRYDYLPIHGFQDSCGYWAVREVVVCLLREYPESYDIPQPYRNGQTLSSIPFIQSIKPLLDEEIELNETATSLKESTSSLTKAVTCTNDDLMRSAFTVFDSWATSFINSTEEKLQLISTQLQDLCDEGLEPDE